MNGQRICRRFEAEVPGQVCERKGKKITDCVHDWATVRARARARFIVLSLRLRTLPELTPVRRLVSARAVISTKNGGMC